MYSPDYWQVLKISSLDREKPIYKVFATWVGGYIRGDEWRMNSGITNVMFEDNCIIFEGSSGSRYVCRNDEHAYRTSGYSGSVLGDYTEKAKEIGASIEVLPFETNWKELNYEY
jgi:hypothetical protein